MSSPKELDLVATTFHGLEEVLSKELLRLGAKNIEQHKRSVSFKGDIGFMYKANFCLRTALRILLPVHKFTFTDADSLYEQSKQIAWDDLMSVDKTFAINCVLNSDLFANNLFPALRIKDALVDFFRDKNGTRPSVDKENPDILIYAHIYNDRCTISLDSSGQSLHLRGYRKEVDKAPISEVLAAGMVLLSDWQSHQPLVDFMCGSGTILIEAALLAGNIPPGSFGRKYAFEKWASFDDSLFETIRESALSRIKESGTYIYGCDRSKFVIEKAMQNVTNAGVDDVIKLRTCDFRDFEKPAPKGTIIINPPYGEKIRPDELSSLYKAIGDKLKKDYAGYTAWLITLNSPLIKEVGLHHSRKITLYNGALECKLLRYELYEGSKKTSKQSR